MRGFSWNLEAVDRKPRAIETHLQGEKGTLPIGGCRRKPLFTTTPGSIPRGIRTRFRVDSPGGLYPPSEL
jgi:hypothetical protein